MSVTGILRFDINTYLNSTGFQQFKSNLKQSMSLSQKFKSVTSSTLGKLAIGYFTISGLVSQYNKAVEASNYQIEQETKLYNTLRAQKFRDEQIKSIIDMTGELQKLGVVGDEVTIAGAQQLATFRLQENSIKSLLPTMQDLLVKQKGLNGTGQDMESIANMFAKSMNGQTIALRRSGIILSEREEQLLKVGTEEQKVALLTDAVRRSIGEQNKEILKTPEGKIVSAKNRIGDLYEVWGMSIRDTRAKFWEFVADNAEGIQDIITKVFKAGGSFVDTFIGVFRDIKRGFNALPDGAKNGLKIVGGLALATKFPLVALGLVVEDIFAAFQGKESFTEDAINALLKFTGTDYKFDDLRKGVSDFFDLLTKGADSGIEKINLTTKVLLDLLDTLKGGAGLLQMIWGATGGVAIDLTKNTFKALSGDFEDMNWDNTTSNIHDGWDKLYGAGQHMNETHKMYQDYARDEFDKRQKKDIENFGYINKNANSNSVPLRKENIQINNVLNNNKAQMPPEIQALFNQPKKNEKYDYINKNVNTNSIPLKKDRVKVDNVFNDNKVKTLPEIKILLNQPKKIDETKFNKTQSNITNKQNVNYNPVFNNNFTINESEKGEMTADKVSKIIKQADEDKFRQWKVQTGMGFTY